VRSSQARIGGFLQRETILEVVARPPLEAQNERIGLRQMIGDNPGSLRRAYVGEQVA
jgi:CHASE2 domain-containing sensor protein